MLKQQAITLAIGLTLGAAGGRVLSVSTIGSDEVKVTSVCLSVAPDAGTEVETCGTIRTGDRPAPARRCTTTPVDACAKVWLEAAPKRLVEAQRLGREHENQIAIQLAQGAKDAAAQRVDGGGK